MQPPGRSSYWKMQWLFLHNATFDLGTWDQLKKDLNDAFKPYVLWMQKAGAPQQGLPEKEKTHSGEFHSPELCLNMGTGINKHAEENSALKSGLVQFFALLG